MRMKKFQYNDERLRSGLHDALDGAALPEGFHARLMEKLDAQAAPRRFHSFALRLAVCTLALMLVCGGALAAMNWLNLFPEWQRKMTDQLIASGGLPQETAAQTEADGIRFSLHYAVTGKSSLITLSSLENTGNQYPSVRYAQFHPMICIDGSFLQTFEQSREWYDAESGRMYQLIMWQLREEPARNAEITLALEDLHWQQFGVQEIAPFTMENLQALVGQEIEIAPDMAAESLTIGSLETENSLAVLHYTLRQKQPLDMELLNGASPDNDWEKMQTSALRAVRKDAAGYDLDLLDLFPPLEYSDEEGGWTYQENDLLLEAEMGKNTVLALVTDYMGPYIYHEDLALPLPSGLQESVQDQKIAIDRDFELDGRKIEVESMLVTPIGMMLNYNYAWEEGRSFMIVWMDDNHHSMDAGGWGVGTYDEEIEMERCQFWMPWPVDESMKTVRLLFMSDTTDDMTEITVDLQ